MEGGHRPVHEPAAIPARIAQQPPSTILWLLLILFFCSSAVAETRNGKVSWIYDGDTIKVTGIGKVRLIGIDSPEKHNSARDNYYSRRYQIEPETLRLIAKQALKFNIDQVKNRRVRLEFDHEQTDTYGRTLAYVILPDGRMLNRMLLEKGLATVYRRFDFRYKKDFLKVESIARDRQLGLWNK